MCVESTYIGVYHSALIVFLTTCQHPREVNDDEKI